MIPHHRKLECYKTLHKASELGGFYDYEGS
jgi:hypothetical protein